MDVFTQLSGRFLALVYHCFDRIVIQVYLLLLPDSRGAHRPFLPDVHGIYPITKGALTARTKAYQQWIEAFARTTAVTPDRPGAKRAGSFERPSWVKPSAERVHHQPDVTSPVIPHRYDHLGRGIRENGAQVS